MKIARYFVIFLMSFAAQAQIITGKDITLKEKQDDDMYLAGESIAIDRQVDGDVVTAGGTISVNDSISDDLIVAGGTIYINAAVDDDIRAAGGKLFINANVGDDVIVFGGEVTVGEKAVIHGNFIAYSGAITIDGKVLGTVKIHSEDLTVNGEIQGTSKIIAESIEIGSKAKFYNDVEYWSESGEIDFKNSVVNGSAIYNASLIENGNEFPWSFFGFAAIGIWIFYLLSAFLIILILNALFNDFFSKAVEQSQHNLMKSLLFGIAYVVGVPVLILFTFIIIVGIPIGLLLIPFYIFSLIIGHLIVAILLAHYINQKNNNNWGVFVISILALGIAAALRIITMLPYVGFIIAVIIISMAFGMLILALIKPKSDVQLVT